MVRSASRLIVIVGETASGKTAMGIEIAKKYNGEIICADSRTIYKGMDIGTAKPTEAEMEGIPHYGLDLVEPNEPYSAAQFKEYAQEKITEITTRGRLPILVGGTGLYVDGVIYDYSFGGGKTAGDLRSKLDNMTDEELKKLAETQNIEIPSEALTNRRHMQRLIERGGETEHKNELQYDALILGISLTRSQLRKRVEARVEKMFRMGLRKEYNDLREEYGNSTEAFTGIGYREFQGYERGEISMSEVKKLIVRNTITILAKKQRTWFKRNQNIHWIQTQEQASELVDGFLTGRKSR